ncbi:MAG TPA: DUF2155 domain-containing protein [Roseiarcus sp.]
MAAAIACAATFGAAGSAWADKIKHPTAVFAGLDKITGRIISFEVAINETVQFGSLQITPRVCYSRPPTEPPRTDVFAEVDEVDENKHTHRIFTGWMFADSPGMHGIEHPVYDIWLTACKGGTQIIHEAPDVADAPLPPDAGDSDAAAAPGANPAANPAAAPTQPPKKRKPKPPPPPAAVDNEPSPLDLGAQPNPPTGRGQMRRYYPTDSDPGLVPPANVGQ